MKILEILHRKQAYKLTSKKVLHILSILENKKLKNLNNEEIEKLLKKYNLLDNIFLDNINKI